MTISITTDTLTLSPAGTGGSRTLAQYGIATAIKVTSTLWYISGTGLT
jgi:peptidoglycan hydrolase-like amidase